MNTTEERIFELLNSTNREDVELGVIIAIRELGKQWCEDNLGYYYNDIDKSEYSSPKYDDGFYLLQNWKHGDSLIILKFNEVSVFIGRVVAVIHPDYEKGHYSNYIIKDMREENIIK